MTGDVDHQPSKQSPSSKDQVLETATRSDGAEFAARSATRPRTPTSVFAMRSVSANSLEVVDHIRRRRSKRQAKGNWDGARQSFQKAVELDPTFALGYQGLAAMARNQGRAAPRMPTRYIQEALKSRSPT